jgi:uncharacterized lipoprotein YajG
MHGLNRLGVMLLAVSFGGCAFGNRHVTLTYPPQQVPVPRPGAAPSSTTTLRPTIVLITFLDQRPTKQTIGSVHNGFGMHTADVVAQNDVAAWVTNAIGTELEKAGFAVTRASASDRSALDAQVSGEVLKVYCEAWTKYEAEVAFDVRVVKDGKEVLRKSFSGKNDSTTNWGASSKSYGQALAVALSNAAGNLATELRRDFGSNQ